MKLKQRLCRYILKIAAATIPLALPSQWAAATSLAIGGWDGNRGGENSLRDGFRADNLRATIGSSFTESTISATSTLTDSYLSTIDLLFVSAVKSNNVVPVSNLSSAEQIALKSFVLNGGGAILISDNSSAYTESSNSMNAPFGVTVSDWIRATLHLSFSNSNNRIANGPFGVSTGGTGEDDGYFTSLGAYAHSLATWDGYGLSALAVIEPGALGPHSGPVVFVSDNFFIDRFGVSSENRITTLNAIAFASSVPEPATTSLIIAGISVVFLSYRRRRVVA